LIIIIFIKLLIDTEQWATANDNVDWNISWDVVTWWDTVDANTVWTYTVTYNVQDAAWNDAVQVTRTVNVVDTIKPVLSLVWNSNIFLDTWETYTEQWATASDNIDGNISWDVVVWWDTVLNWVEWIYVVTYNVQDTAWNSAVQVTRTVEIIDL